MDWIHIAWWVVPLLAAPYIVGPLLVRFTNKQAVLQEFDRMDMAADLPPAVTAIFEQSLKSLAPHGFTATDFLSRQAQGFNPAIYLALLRSPVTQDHCMAVAMFINDALQTAYVEFATDYVGGMELSTTNGTTPNVMPMSPGKVMLRVTQQDAADVFKIHQALQRHLAKGRQKIFETGDGLAMLQKSMRKEMDQPLQDGYYFVSSDGKYFWPTLYGAFVMTYRLLPPFSWIRKAAENRECDALLKQLDLEPALASTEG